MPFKHAGKPDSPLVRFGEKLDPTNDQIATGATGSQTGGQEGKVVISSGVGFDAQVIQASACRLYGYVFNNFSTTSLGFVKFYDKATDPDPSAGDIPKWIGFCRPISSNSDGNPSSFNFDHGLALANGLAICIVTGGAHTDENAVGAGKMAGAITWKS